VQYGGVCCVSRPEGGAAVQAPVPSAVQRGTETHVKPGGRRPPLAVQSGGNAQIIHANVVHWRFGVKGERLLPRVRAWHRAGCRLVVLDASPLGSKAQHDWLQIGHAGGMSLEMHLHFPFVSFV
jgi:hypothetical protein